MTGNLCVCVVITVRTHSSPGAVVVDLKTSSIRRSVVTSKFHRDWTVNTQSQDMQYINYTTVYPSKPASDSPSRLGAMLEAYYKLHPKPKSITELKEALQVIWDGLPQKPIDRAVKSFLKRLKKWVKAGGGNVEHLKWMQIVHCDV